MKQRKVISILLTAAMVVTMAAGCVKQEPAGKRGGGSCIGGSKCGHRNRFGTGAGRY